MNKFLESVAGYYLDRSSDMGRTLLVVPNKRSGMYLRYYLKMLSTGPIIMPRIMTMAAFMAELAGKELSEATRLEQLFTLYKVHTAVRIENGVETRPFDQFAFWGEIMLDDFDDIDSNLADVDGVLKNVGDYREIESDFLTEEQIEVAREVWGYDLKANGTRFWKHIRHGNDVDETFLSLWRLLIPTYHRFHRELNERGLATRGRLARLGAERSADITAAELGRDRIGFIGFNILTGAERTVFRNLSRRGLAEFFWDEPLSLTRDLPKDSSDFIPLKNYIRHLKRTFPMPDGYERARIVAAPDIDIAAVPSNSMQAKLTKNILEGWTANGLADRDRPDSTAIVLPAPAILTTLLHSLPDSDKYSLNITMGLPVRHTPFATFLSALIRMYLRASTNRDEVLTFLSEDVVAVINHPTILMLGGEDSVAIKKFLSENRRVTLSIDELNASAGELHFLFSDRAVKNHGIEGVRDLFTGIIEGISERLRPLADNSDDASKSKLHEIKLLEAYRTAVDTIAETALRFGQEPELEDLRLDTRTFIILMEKLLRRDNLNMSGAPMRGLQVMGPLETRSLDFDNVIMLSANERTFPKKTFFKSLIPHSIRVGYGLTTVEHSELQYAWIFYNLISRSKRAVFMYDARQEKVGSNEMSRYLFQISHIFTKLKPKQTTVIPTALKTDNEEIRVEKTDKIVREVRRFLTGGDKRLSASSLRDYLKCPLRFYIRHVKGMREDVKPTEYIDSSTIGTLVHAVFEDFYKPLKGIEISPERIAGRIEPMKINSMLATKLNNDYYRGKYTDCLNFMPGEALMLVEVLGEKIVDVLKTESRYREQAFTYIAGEQRPETEDGVVDWRLNDGLSIRFTYSIDRIDRLDDGTLRFIDYKTGSDKVDADSVDEIFGTDDKEPVGALFQILAYANVYATTHPEVIDIHPEILKIFKAKDSITKGLKIGNRKTGITSIESYHDVPDFVEKLADRLKPLFDDSTPFVQTPNTANCKYCQFNTICNRPVDESF